MNTTDKVLSQNGIRLAVPSSLHDLIERRRELDEMTEYEPETYAALWEALAEDFDAIYPGGINAQKCRDKANHYRFGL